MPRRYWLVKSEPDVFSIDDLAAAPGRTTSWTGVRNHQAKNYLIEMRPGDRVLYYHSNGDPAGVAGLAEVAAPAYADPTQFDPADPYHDPTAPRTPARWMCVDVRFVEKFVRLVSLGELRTDPALETMALLRRGNRLSVMPVERAQFERICRLGQRG